MLLGATYVYNFSVIEFEIYWLSNQMAMGNFSDESNFLNKSIFSEARSDLEIKAIRHETP